MLFRSEPYYESWCGEDVEGLFGRVALRLVETDMAFLTKAWAFRRA